LFHSLFIKREEKERRRKRGEAMISFPGSALEKLKGDVRYWRVALHTVLLKGKVQIYHYNHIL